MRSPIVKAWRKHLAEQLWRFRRIKGRWPDHDVHEAAKLGMMTAADLGMWPPTFN